MPAIASFAHTSAHHTSSLQVCLAQNGHNDAKDSLVVSFACKKASAMPRFAKAKVPFGIEEGVWHDCRGKVPFGWQTQWGPFDYPQYAVTTQGIVGCKTTDADYCTPQNRDLFAFEPSFDWDNYARDPNSGMNADDGSPLDINLR